MLYSSPRGGQPRQEKPRRSHDREVALQVLQQFLGIGMLWEQSERLMHHREALLELTALVVEISKIEDRLEEVVGRLL